MKKVHIVTYTPRSEFFRREGHSPYGRRPFRFLFGFYANESK